MRYDIGVIHELCCEIGLSSRLDGDDCVKIDVGQGAVLIFQNDEHEDDCLVGFADTPWHAHGGIMFADPRGYYVELEYLDLLVALKEGHVLVCERIVGGQIVDRWLTHHEYNDEFTHMNQSESIVVRRAATKI